MTDSKPYPQPKLKWRITIGLAAAFAAIGLIFSCSIPTTHPGDRLVNIAIITTIFFTTGLLIGYVASLVYYKRFHWTDACVSITLPLILLIGFWFAKSGDRTTAGTFGWIAFSFLVFLVYRFTRTLRPR